MVIEGGRGVLVASMSIWVSPYSSRFLSLLGDDVMSFKLSENEE